MGDTRARTNWCICREGGQPREWENKTLVCKAAFTNGVDASGGYTITNVAPFPRADSTEYDFANPGLGCITKPIGFCGTWLKNGDYGGLSERLITATVDDIMACAAENDENHRKLDHNCYVRTTAPIMTVDNRTKQRVGKQALLAKKQHHGRFGIIDINNPHIATSVAFTAARLDSGGGFGAITYTDDSPGTFPAAISTLYRTATGHLHYYEGDGTIATEDITLDGFASVERHSGITSNTGLATPLGSGEPLVGHFGPDIGTPAWTAIQRSWNEYFQIFAGDFGYDASLTPNAYCVLVSGVYQFWSGIYDPHGDGSNLGPDYMFASVTIDSGGFSRSSFFQYTTDDWVTTAIVNLTSETVAVSNTRIDYHYHQIGFGDDDFVYRDAVGWWQLDDPYTFAELLEDYQSLQSDWVMSRIRLAKPRRDELAALAPLLIFDEVTATAPAPEYVATMDDYASPQNMDGTWPQRAWHDPSDCQWLYNGSVYTMPVGFTGAGGTVLLTGLRTGSRINYNGEGYERHFWFNYNKKKREEVFISGVSVGFTWINDTHGALSDDEASLPICTMRWMDRQEAQYEAHPSPSYTPAPGNYPHDWMRYRNQVLLGQKHVEAAMKWYSVNYGRPCGWDKFAVEQGGVCCILAVLSATQFTVCPTYDAANPLATGGLQVGDYVFVEGEGTRLISGITLDGGGTTWTVTTGAVLDGLPTGFTMSTITGDWMGKLRWPTSPGICGRAPITTSFDSGTGLVTITTGAEIATLRINAITGTILVDLYDATMANKVQATLTRVTDSSFTFTHAALPNHVWMTGRDVDYTKYNDNPKRTGIRLEWAFNYRDQQLPSGSQPVWLGGSTPGTGLSGCTGLTNTQFNFDYNICNSMVGGVPFYLNSFVTPPQMEPFESFTNQKLFETPVISGDATFGALGLNATMMTMTDPFWQKPFRPLCANADPLDIFTWTEDNGNGQEDDEFSIPIKRYYAHRPLVEAAKDIPAGMSLPAGVTLFYDATISPPYYPNGIPNANDASGNYIGVDSPWGFWLAACTTIHGGLRFAGDYAKFVQCEEVD